MKPVKSILLTVAVTIALGNSTALGQTPMGTEFTYQGSLREGGELADGPHDIDVGLWDAASGGVQIGSTQSFPAVPVAGGLFTLELDFGTSAFDNSDRFLELTVNTAIFDSIPEWTPRTGERREPKPVYQVSSPCSRRIAPVRHSCSETLVS